MKTKIALLILFISFTYFTFAQENISRKEKKQNQFEETLNLINSGNYSFEANKALPKGGNIVDLTTNPNYLKISNDSIDAYLPFFGERYIVNDYGGNGAIQMKGPLTDYNIIPNEDKLRIEIQFKVKTRHDVFSCFMNISYDGNSSLDIDSSSRSHINYIGKTRPLDK